MQTNPSGQTPASCGLDAAPGPRSHHFLAWRRCRGRLSGGESYRRFISSRLKCRPGVTYFRRFISRSKSCASAAWRVNCHSHSRNAALRVMLRDLATNRARSISRSGALRVIFFIRRQSQTQTLEHPSPPLWRIAPRCLYNQPHAGVAELADAPDSKSGGRKAVWVRFPPPAPFSARTSKEAARPPKKSTPQTRAGAQSAAGTRSP
jgi:hypothetical protein